MASSIPNTAYHVRSNSFPTKAHPIVSEVDEHLCRIRSSDNFSSSSISICQKLSGLQDLYDCVNKLLLLPLTQQDLVQRRNEKWAEDLLEGSLNLLHLCSIAKEALLQTKESVGQLQSALRRRRGDEMETINEVKKYLTSRKMVKKAVHKALKEIGNKPAPKNEEAPATLNTLKEAKSITLNAVETLLSFTGGSNLPSKFAGWSLVSRLVHSKKVASGNEESDRNEFDMVDAALHSVSSQKTSESDYKVQVKNLKNCLKKFDSNIQDLDESLDSFYRCLIKTRVSLLNILNN